MSLCMSVIRLHHLPKINFHSFCPKLPLPQYETSCLANENSSLHLTVGPRAFPKHMALDRKEEFVKMTFLKCFD